MSDNVAIMVELDYCVGCYACQTACQEYNHLPIKETYMRCVLTKPERVDGDVKSFMTPVPLAPEHCSECLEREGTAPCSKICIGSALHIGSKAEMLQKVAETSGQVALYA